MADSVMTENDKQGKDNQCTVTVTVSHRLMVGLMTSRACISPPGRIPGTKLAIE